MPEEPTASRYLVVVHRDKPAVFATVTRDLAEFGVEIIWDRRHGDRRKAQQPVQPDRRSGERRGIPPLTWTTLGFVMVSTTRGSEPGA